ncbi:glycosyl hydrolase family 18 protein [Clostridium formicaceticum]|uniref:chitinase n=1 Tax=Clostridium formicaceticum TaxID=1497 RepID=A0AAC9WFU8_9CLOT|nr:glycosyl hydrolase family 18 protein [Clostridium formicaceticum]AOY76825.1 hypothetical protein BJL90_13765 [Clostridium formicaceticum]ARE87297.1 Chitinase A1 precursor [Clostridium formicaceticum]
MNKIFKRIIIFALMYTLILPLFSSGSYIFADESKEFRVVGYYSEIFDDPVDNLQFDKLTHITYAFLIPAVDGSLIGIEKPEKLKELVKKSHENEVDVLIAVGGWSYQNLPLDPTFEMIAASDETREIFIDNIISFVDEYNLDGVEIDWEYPDLGQSSQNYEKLVLGLSKKLKEKQKYLTAALNGAWSATEGPSASQAVSDKCLEEFDWINIMAYDMNNEQHSPYWFSKTSIDYWITRGLEKKKIVLGVPFYARPSWKQYRHLVLENKENAYRDYAEGEPLDSYYNGINTIKEKTRLALKNASGIMIFDINEDTNDELSLLKAINDTITEVTSMTSDELNKKIYFVVDDSELVFKREDNMGIPFIDENNRVLVPIRKPLEMIGAGVSYDEETKTVVAKKEDTILEVSIDMNYVKVNDTTVGMDTKAVIKDGRSYAPFRYIFEAFEYKVEWHDESRTAIVIK